MSNMGSALKSDILLVPHHGSRTSCSGIFLKSVGARLCIISSGTGNYFRFPHKETLERLQKSGCRIMRTDQSGAIEISFKRNGLDIETYLDNS